MSSRSEFELAQQAGASPCDAQIADMFVRSTGNAARLASVVFDDIVPRLHLLHHELSAKDAERAFTRDEITEFGEILINDDNSAAEKFLQKMRARGHSEETLFLGLMAETARHLGALWEHDLCNFVDVTLGVARLQKLLCVFSGLSEPAHTDNHQRALLCSLPEERHVFGLDMVACFMRHACWSVEVQKGAEAHHIADMVGRDWFSVLGFTLSAESGLESLCRAIQSGRSASINPGVGILVGGPLFRNHPNLVAQVGADALATDAASASLLAKKFLLRQRVKSGRHNGSALHGLKHDGAQQAPA